MISKNSDKHKEVTIPEATLQLKEDGIMYIYLKANIIYDIEVQNKLLKHYHEITYGKPTPFLFEAESGIVVTQKSREYSVKMENHSPCNATAAVTNSLIYKFMCNFYLHFNKPVKPYKIFSDKNLAIVWLKNYVDKE
jgi:hypothetical protein